MKLIEQMKFYNDGSKGLRKIPHSSVKKKNLWISSLPLFRPQQALSTLRSLSSSIYYPPIRMRSPLSRSVLAIGLVAASISQAAPTTYPPSAIYTLYNNPNNASIIAMSISENGTIFGSPIRTPTGGKGLSGVTGVGQPNVGALFGSDALVVGDNVRIF